MANKNPWLIEIGKNIRKEREGQCFSQEHLADLVGIDRTYIGGIERGERNVATLNLIRIALALDIEVSALFPATERLKNLQQKDE